MARDPRGAEFLSSTWNRNRRVAVACHPFGATGGRVTIQLLRELQRRDLELGLISVCAAGGTAWLWSSNTRRLGAMQAHRPLEGLIVVDLSRHLPGPLTARILSDLGARVIKLEEPTQGDPIRGAPPFINGKSALAEILLAGVESVAVDLRVEEAAHAARQIAGKADILLESFRPGTLARFGLAPESLREDYPRLIVCSISGWGQSGPSSGRSGHDLTYQAIAGSLASRPGPSGQPVADLIGSWSAVSAILAALRRRDLEGQGCWIDTALLDASVHSNLVAWAMESHAPQDTGQPLPLTGNLPCYDVYATRDGGYLALGALEPHFWKAFCRLSGRRDLESKQYSNKRKTRKAVGRLVASRSRAEWLDLLSGEDLPIEIVLSPSEALQNPQMHCRQLFSKDDSGVLRPGYPSRIDGERPRAIGKAPLLGEHSKKVLEELGLPARIEGVGAKRGWRERLRGLALRWSSNLFLRP